MLVHSKVTPSYPHFSPKVTPRIKLADTHLYTWVERGTGWREALAQEHNRMCPARARTARSGDERTNHEATAPPLLSRKVCIR